MVEIIYAPRNLFAPGRFSSLVDDIVETIKELASKCGTGRRRQLQGFSDDFLVSSFHDHKD